MFKVPNDVLFCFPPLRPVEVDPHGDRALTFSTVEEPLGQATDSEKYKIYNLNKAVHAALAERGYPKDARGHHKGVFAAEPIYPSSMKLKDIRSAFDNSVTEAPLFPFPGNLKVSALSSVAWGEACHFTSNAAHRQDMLEWVSKGIEERRKAEEDVMPIVSPPVVERKTKKKKAATTIASGSTAGQKRRREPEDDVDD
jgi:hypothetical protein